MEEGSHAMLGKNNVQCWKSQIFDSGVRRGSENLHLAYRYSISRMPVTGLDGRCPSLDSSPLSLRATAEKFSAVNLERARCASRHKSTSSAADLTKFHCYLQSPQQNWSWTTMYKNIAIAYIIFKYGKNETIWRLFENKLVSYEYWIINSFRSTEK